MSAVRCGMPHVTKVRRISSSHRALDDNSHHSKRYSEMYKGRSQPSFFGTSCVRYLELDLRTIFDWASTFHSYPGPYNVSLGSLFLTSKH